MLRRPNLASCTTELINVDLEVTARRDLSDLVLALSERSRMHVLFNDRVGRNYHATLELGGRAATSSSAISNDPERLIRRMVQIIERLPPASRARWDAATRRCFDLGFACGDSELQIPALTPATLRSVAALGACIAISLYPPSRT